MKTHDRSVALAREFFGLEVGHDVRRASVGRTTFTKRLDRSRMPSRSYIRHRACSQALTGTGSCSQSRLILFVTVMELGRLVSRACAGDRSGWASAVELRKVSRRRLDRGNLLPVPRSEWTSSAGGNVGPRSDLSTVSCSDLSVGVLLRPRRQPIRRPCRLPASRWLLKRLLIDSSMVVAEQLVDQPVQPTPVPSTVGLAVVGTASSSTEVLVPVDDHPELRAPVADVVVAGDLMAEELQTRGTMSIDR